MAIRSRSDAWTPEGSPNQKSPYDLQDPQDSNDLEDAHGCADEGRRWAEEGELEASTAPRPVFVLAAEAEAALTESLALPAELVVALIDRERYSAPTCTGVAREEESWRDPMWIVANALSSWPAFADLRPHKAADSWEALVRRATGCRRGEEWDAFEEHFADNPSSACYSDPREAFISCWGRGHERVAIVGPQIVDDARWLADHFPLSCCAFDGPRHRSFLRFISLCYWLQRLGDGMSFYLSRAVASRALEVKSIRLLQVFFRRAVELRILELINPGCFATHEATYYAWKARVEVEAPLDQGGDDEEFLL